MMYRYLNSKSMLKTLENKNLRVGRIDEMNDPFEFCLAYESNRENQTIIQIVNEQLNYCVGVVCFSGPDTLTNHLMWSHYAENHRGIALGIEPKKLNVQSPNIKKLNLSDMNNPIAFNVEYSSSNDRFRIPSEYFEKDPQEMLEKIIVPLGCTKGGEWKYEKEIRAIVSLSSAEQSQGSYFIPLDCEELKEIVFGWKCPQEIKTYVRNLIHSDGSFNRVKLREIRCSKSEFSLGVHDI